MVPPEDEETLKSPQRRDDGCGDLLRVSILVLTIQQAGLTAVLLRTTSQGGTGPHTRGLRERNGLLINYGIRVKN